jgi:UDP-3-O-[3-hydroxymyristoyl] N-acetylglucosamine deacetylase
MDDYRVLNRDGLRWPDEFVRHKVLDLLGDLALLGMPVEGHIHVERGGHALHQRFVQALLAHPDHWQVETELPTVVRRPARARRVAGVRASA